MKKITRSAISITIAALTAASCLPKVNLETGFARLFEFCRSDIQMKDDYTRIEEEWPDRTEGSEDCVTTLEYLTLLAMREVGEKNVETIETPSGEMIIARLKGAKPKWSALVCSHVSQQRDSLGQMAGDPLAASLSAIEVLRSFKKTRLRPSPTVYVLISDFDSSTEMMEAYKRYITARDKDKKASKKEKCLLQIHLDSIGQDGDGARTFTVGEPREIFLSIHEVMKQYLQPYGEYTLVNGPIHDPSYPFPSPLYGYSVDRATMEDDAAAVASLILLN